MAKGTKERILAAALEQFSQNGYAGTNIRELTASLGLVKSAMYKHFESKEDIWNTLLDEMIVYYNEHFGSSDHLLALLRFCLYFRNRIRENPWRNIERCLFQGQKTYAPDHG